MTRVLLSLSCLAIFSLSVSACIAPLEPTPTPTECSQAPTLTGQAGDATNTLTWTQLAGLTYTLSRAVVSGGPYTQDTSCQVSTSGNTASCTDSGLFTGQTYYYVLSASASCGQAPQSSEVALTPRPTSSSARQARYALLQQDLQNNLSGFETSWTNALTTPNTYIYARDLIAMLAT